MTHDELLAKISLGEKFEGTGWSVDGNLLIKQSFALRAVVELHGDDEGYCRVCMVDYYCDRYPCETIQAITKELN